MNPNHKECERVQYGTRTSELWVRLGPKATSTGRQLHLTSAATFSALRRALLNDWWPTKSMPFQCWATFLQHQTKRPSQKNLVHHKDSMSGKRLGFEINVCGIHVVSAAAWFRDASCSGGALAEDLAEIQAARSSLLVSLHLNTTPHRAHFTRKHFLACSSRS